MNLSEVREKMANDLYSVMEEMKKENAIPTDIDKYLEIAKVLVSLLNLY